MPGNPATQFLDLGYGDPAAEAFFDMAQQVLGTLGRLDLTLVNATTIRALAGAGADEAGMGVGGALRFRNSNVDRAMPGGGAGRYDVYVTTGPTLIAPGDPPIDTTDYSWDLAIVAGGGAAPGTAYSKKVGYLDWSGVAITRLVQTFGRRDDTPVHAVAPTAEETPLEAIQPAGATAPAIRAVVGGVEVFRVESDGDVVMGGTAATSMTRLTLSATDTSALAISSGAGGITIGDDTNLYRRAADVLGTSDAFGAAGAVTALYGLTAQTSIGNVGPGGVAGITMQDVTLYRGAAARLDTAAGLRLGGNLTFSADGGSIVFGAAGDTNLYRSAANVLRTNGEFFAGSTITANTGGANQVRFSNAGKLEFGPLVDVNLYRQNVNILMTDDSFFADGDLRAQQNQVTRVRIGAAGPASEAGIQFGSAGDTNLYRQAAGILRTDGTLLSSGPSAASTTLASRTGGDTGPPRFAVLGSGTLEWGDGTAARDVVLSRVASDVLGVGLGDRLQVNPNGAATLAFNVVNMAEAASRFGLYADGKMEWGDGATARDTNLYRGAVDRLQTDDAFTALGGYYATRPTAAGHVLQGNVTGDAQARLWVGADGKMEWGPGNAARDTNLFRSAADRLKTDDALDVALEFRHLGATLGFYGVAATARPAVRTLTNWTGANADRAIDRNAFTLLELFDFTMTMVDDLRTLGLFA